MPITPLLAESWIAPLAFALGCGLLTALLLRRSYRYFGKKRRGGSGPHLEAQPRPTHAWDGAKQDASARFDRQQVELQELARDLTGQIDSKLLLLQELNAKSERQIQRLEELLAETEHAKAERE